MINATNSTTAASAAETSAQMGTKALDRDAFLKLLITELRNQDPTSPMDDKEFIAQLAQFSSLEQMQKMNTTLQSLIESQVAFMRNQSGFEALNLIGRTVNATDPDTGDTVSGSVGSVLFKDGAPILKVGDKEVPLSWLVSIS